MTCNGFMTVSNWPGAKIYMFYSTARGSIVLEQGPTYLNPSLYIVDCITKASWAIQAYYKVLTHVHEKEVTVNTADTYLCSFGWIYYHRSVI